MSYYTIKDELNQVFDEKKHSYLHFLVKGNGCEFIDNYLPNPNFFYWIKNYKNTLDTYAIGYIIDGYFGTLKGTEFINDIVARFLLTLPIVDRVDYQPSIDTLQHKHVWRLKDFQNLKSINGIYKQDLKGFMNNDDNTFWELKLWVENRIKDNGGEGNYVSFELLLDHALKFYKFKDRSTGRAKCRSIWEWYEKRSWNYHILKSTSKTKNEILQLRRDNALKNSKKIGMEKRESIFSILEGNNSKEYKKSDGRWYVAKIIRDAGVSRNTAIKYINEFDRRRNEGND